MTYLSGDMISFVANNITYTLYFPLYPINVFVDHYVLMKGESLYQEERIFPNNKAELFINLGDELIGKMNNCTYEYHLKESVLSGIRDTYFTFKPGNNFFMIGLRFTLFGFYQLFRIPSHYFRDQNVDTRDIWGQEMADLREQLYETNDENGLFSTLNRWVESKASNADLRESIKWQKVEHEVKKTILPVNALLKEVIGYSHKHSISLFKEKAGLRPKLIQKVNRFESALYWLARSKAMGLPYQDYSDQSHFIREFKSFTGFTPGEYLTIKPKTYILYQHLKERD